MTSRDPQGTASPPATRRVDDSPITEPLAPSSRRTSPDESWTTGGIYYCNAPTTSSSCTARHGVPPDTWETVVETGRSQGTDTEPIGRIDHSISRRGNRRVAHAHHARSSPTTRWRIGRHRRRVPGPAGRSAKPKVSSARRRLLIARRLSAARTGGLARGHQHPNPIPRQPHLDQQHDRNQRPRLLDPGTSRRRSPLRRVRGARQTARKSRERRRRVIEGISRHAGHEELSEQSRERLANLDDGVCSKHREEHHVVKVDAVRAQSE